MKKLTLTLLALTAASSMAQAQRPPRYENSEPLYHEAYRPQYHYTKSQGWVGDPSGLLKYKGIYRGYGWGAITSEDLVHWKELNRHSIKNVPEEISTFTGSVLVDENNTAGYGKDVLLAAFTSFDKDSKKQSQSIAFSRDGGDTFNYYDQNPVLDLWSTEFRDPTVFWDENSGQWVMAVAKALNKKVGFYGSPDMKTWTWLSDFGPMGDQERSWECPDIFQVSVDGDPNNKKWVLLVSVNWADEQYFVGEWNGKEFIPDQPNYEPLYVDKGMDYYASRVFRDYDEPNGPVYTLGWVNTWDYAQQAPSKWGNGVWSLVREYRLKSTPDGLRLTQTPVAALEQLRGKGVKFDSRLKSGVTPLKQVSAMDNCYELEATFSTTKPDVCGFMLCEGDGRKLTVSYDTESQTLTVDRMNTSDVKIPKFDRVKYCKVAPENGELKLRIFVDKTTVEIFAGDGQTVMTNLTYAAPGQTGASVFSLRGNTRLKMEAWPLASIWD